MRVPKAASDRTRYCIGLKEQLKGFQYSDLRRGIESVHLNRLHARQDLGQHLRRSGPGQRQVASARLRARRFLGLSLDARILGLLGLFHRVRALLRLLALQLRLLLGAVLLLLGLVLDLTFLLLER